MDRAEELNVLCCLHEAWKSFEERNYSTDIRIMLSVECFSSNMTTQAVTEFINRSQDLISKKACYDDSISFGSLCDIPTSSGNIGYAIFLAVLMLLVFSTNMFFCLAMFYSRTLLNNSSHRFILSLAISDLLIALIAIPIKIKYTIHNQEFCSSESLCQLAYLVDHLIFLSSIFILFAIGLDRYIALSHPYKYQCLMNKNRSKALIISIWVISGTLGVMANVNWNTFTFNGVGIVDQNCVSKSRNYTGAIYIAGFFVPLVAMGFLYYKIFRITLTHVILVPTMGDFEGQDEQECAKPRRSSISCFTSAKLRAMRVVVLVYGSFVICWLPGNIMNILNVWWPSTISIETWQFHLFNEILPLSNSALNVFVYAAMNEDCKKAMQKMLSCKIVQTRIRKKRMLRESQRRESARTINFSMYASEV